MPSTQPDIFGPLQGGERRLWRGRCAVAEYAFGEAASLPRWALPETTEVLVTDHRIAYAYTRSESPDDLEVTSGDLRWLWPQHLRVQPGARTAGRAAAAAQIQLVCAASDGSFPALVFAGGDLATIGDADRLANLIRHAIAGFRVDNAERLGLSTAQARMLSRLLIGPEFSNFQGGEGQTVTLLGALPVNRPADPVAEIWTPALPSDEPAHSGPTAILAAPLTHEPAPAHEPAVVHAAARIRVPAPTHDSGTIRETAARPAAITGPVAGPVAGSAAAPAARSAAAPVAGSAVAPVAGSAEVVHPASVSGTSLRVPGLRPGLAADQARALQAAAAEEAAHVAQPDLASRAADLAARVASLVSEQPFTAPPAAAPDDIPTTDLAARAATVRRAAARFAANSAKGKAVARRPEHEIGSTSRGHRTG